MHVLTLMGSTMRTTGAGAVDDTVHAGVRAIFRTAMAHTLGNVDEIVTAKASRMGRATPSFFPAAMADHLRTGLASGHTAAGVDELTDLVVTHGFDTFILSADGADQLPRFTEEVVPAVRAQVEAARMSRRPSSTPGSMSTSGGADVRPAPPLHPLGEPGR